MNTNYKFHLEKYQTKATRHTCPSCGKKFCFALYVDETNKPISAEVGRCEHLNSCGYHFTPSEYFAKHPDEKKDYTGIVMPQQKKEVKTDYIPFSLIQRSESISNTLMDYLTIFFDADKITQTTKEYHLGSTKKREIIYPQIDLMGMCRTGKVMQYDTEGHRIKGEIDRIDWLHSRLMKKQGKQVTEFHLTQCLFGEHLLRKRPKDIVCIVEGEKTAVICSIVFPANVWVSCGGEKLFSADRCRCLAGRDVIVYPDADAVDLWRSKMQELAFCHSIKLSEWWRNEPSGSKRDIADLLLEQLKPKPKPTTIGDVCKWMQEAGISKNRITFNI